MSQTVKKLTFDVEVLRAAMAKRKASDTPINIRPYVDQDEALEKLSTDLNLPKMALVRYGIDLLLANAQRVA